MTVVALAVPSTPVRRSARKRATAGPPQRAESAEPNQLRSTQEWVLASRASRAGCVSLSAETGFVHRGGRRGHRHTRQE